MTKASIKKVLILNDKIIKAKESIKTKNKHLEEIMNVFDKTFEELMTLMSKIGEDEILTDDQTEDRKNFIGMLNLNRGDYNKNRFNKKKLKKSACIEDQISRLTKTLIETIEDENLSSDLVKAFHECNIYQILYHNGVIGYYTRLKKYPIATPPLGPTIMQFAMVGLGFSTVSVALFATVALLGLSGGWIVAATALFGSAIAYMAGLLYGIINDIFATKANLPYFLLGHQSRQYSLFVSNDRFVQAIGWGINAALPIAILASIIFGVTIAAVMASATSPILTFALPILLMVVPLFAVCANVYANLSAEKYMQNGISLKFVPETIRKEIINALSLEPDAKSIDLDKIDFDSEHFRKFITKHDLLNTYQLDGLSLMCSSQKDKANWLANHDRNLLGYIGTSLFAITGLVLMLTLTSVPAVLFSPLYATIIPLVAAAIAIASLATALSYVSIYQEKQIDNRYKLFTIGKDGENKLDELYIPNDEYHETHTI